MVMLMSLTKTTALTKTIGTTHPSKPSTNFLAQSETTRNFVNSALSRLIELAKSSQDERDMEALGLIIFYLDSLENPPTQAKSAQIETNEIYLESPITLTL